MALTRELLAQLHQLIRPLRIQVANTVARAVLKVVDDSKTLQVVQVEAPETVPDGEHFQPYGFFSVPFAGAEGVALFPMGDRSHPLIVVMSDRRYRPTNGQPGEAGLRTDEGDEIRLARGHAVVVTTSGTIQLGGPAAAERSIKGDTRNTAEQTFLTALNTFVVALGGLPGMSGPAGTFETAISAFASAVAGALSSVVKIQ